MTFNNNINYGDFIPRENGFIFKIVKNGEQFIHTFIEGALLEKVGFKPEYVIGKTLFDFFPQQQARQKLVFYQKAWGGETVNYEGNVGDIFYLVTLFPIKVNSTVVEVIGTAIDTTIEKQREIHVQKLEKLSVVGQLAAGIAHEIRNPLTSIKGFTQLVKESVNNEHIERYLSTTLDELERINDIVNEFMFIAKPSEKLIFKPTNINSLLLNVINFMEPQSNMKSLIIKPYFLSNIVADCDPDKIKQVLINILRNSIESTNNSANHIGVVLKEVNEHYYLIEITDKGCGISEGRQKKLFEPFYSTKEKGIGLGLMICKRIIDVHQGTIEITSKVGEGTTVKILLPKTIKYKAN